MRPCDLLLPLLLLQCLAAADESWTNCPPACRCRWVSGRKVADCSSSGLASLPGGLSGEIQVCDLSGNALASLPAHAFRAAALVNLHKVFLRGCGIRRVDKSSFSGLEILIELDLSRNAIRDLHPLTFKDNVRLRILRVDHNPLARLEDGLFSGLRYLQAVDASSCQVTHVGRKAFADVPKLHDLNLSRNNLTTLRLASLEHVRSLVGLGLVGNPWRCDCHLRPFLDWAVRRRLYTAPTACAEPPRLAGRFWSDLAEADLACRPQVHVPRVLVDASSGGSATLACRAQGSPPPDLHWLFNSRLLGNNTRRRKYSTAEAAAPSGRWLNLTVTGVGAYDAGNYTCAARSAGGSDSRNVTLTVGGVLFGVEGSTMRAGALGEGARPWVLVLALGAGASLLAAGVAALVLRLCRRPQAQASGAATQGAAASGAACEQKLLLAAVNPIQKPPRRSDRAVVASVAAERSEVTLNLLDNGAAYRPSSSSEEDRLRDFTEQPPQQRSADSQGPYPPDLLPFPPHDVDDPSAGTEVSPLLARRSPSAGRQPRVVSWGSGSAFDNLGPRTTANGSSTLSLDKVEGEDSLVRLAAAGGGTAVVLASRRARLAHRNSWSPADDVPLRLGTARRAAYVARELAGPRSGQN